MNTIELTVLVRAQKAIDVALREFASGKPLTMATATPLAKSSGALSTTSSVNWPHQMPDRIMKQAASPAVRAAYRRPVSCRRRAHAERLEGR